MSSFFSGPDAPSRTAIREKWAHDKLVPSLEPMVTAILRELPEDPKAFMSKYLAEKKMAQSKGETPPAPAAEDVEHEELARRTTRRSIISGSAPLMPPPVSAGAPAGTKLTVADYMRLREAFRAIDKDGSNSLSIVELAAALHMDGSMLASRMVEFDPDHDGQVSFQELVAALYHTPSPVPKKETPTVAAGELFTDPEFPPNDDSVFKTNGYAGDNVEAMRQTLGGSPKWVRASELTGHGQLFNNIHPNDIAQGYVGDCWLLAGLAGLAEFEGAVHNCFEEKKASPNGMYNIRIYDPVAKNWEVVTIDDWIPTVASTGSPISAKPQGHEMWVLLIEKAFAKWFGSYCQLQGAYCLLPYMLLVQCDQPCLQYSQNYTGAPPWNEQEYQGLMPHLNDAHDRAKIGLAFGPKADQEHIFEQLCKADETNHIMCAWTMKDPPTVAGVGASGEHIASDGIVKGHAYSLISAKDVQADGKRWKVVQLRNPWGANPASEWKGKLSDNWEGWSDHPELKKELGVGHPAVDGMFWMDWDDFRARYSDVGIVPKEMDVPKLGIMEHASSKADSQVSYKKHVSPYRLS